MNDKIEEKEESRAHFLWGSVFLAASVASYSALRAGNIKVAFLFYQRLGGCGLNFYKIKPNGQYHRFFALDYHPIEKAGENKLHYHRGENGSQMKKHRPYQGGW